MQIVSQYMNLKDLPVLQHPDQIRSQLLWDSHYIPGYL